ASRQGAGHQHVDTRVREEDIGPDMIHERLRADGIPTETRDRLEREEEIFLLARRSRPPARVEQPARMKRPRGKVAVRLQKPEEEAPPGSLKMVDQCDRRSLDAPRKERAPEKERPSAARAKPRRH